MLKYAGFWSGLSTKAYEGAKGIGKALLTKEDPVTKARRFSGKRIALTAGGLYAGHKVLGEMKKQQDNLSRNYMDDMHPYRPSDTLRIAR
jgi:hypothetical protein